MLLFCYADDKGSCTMIQSSASFEHFLGYQKYMITGKPMEIIFPKFLLSTYHKNMENCIKLSQKDDNNQIDLSQEDNNHKLNKYILFLKNRLGYVYPLLSAYTISYENEYSDLVLIKAKFENNDPKLDYIYYILTNSDLGVENISYGSINLGLSLDLLRKYIVKLDVLIRTENNSPLNIFEKYNKYEEEQKTIAWIFPILFIQKMIQKKKQK